MSHKIIMRMSSIRMGILRCWKKRGVVWLMIKCSIRSQEFWWTIKTSILSVTGVCWTNHYLVIYSNLERVWAEVSNLVNDYLRVWLEAPKFFIDYARTRVQSEAQKIVSDYVRAWEEVVQTRAVGTILIRRRYYLQAGNASVFTIKGGNKSNGRSRATRLAFHY